jgi:hypothetical protein
MSESLPGSCGKLSDASEWSPRDGITLLTRFFGKNGAIGKKNSPEANFFQEIFGGIKYVRIFAA